MRAPFNLEAARSLKDVMSQRSRHRKFVIADASLNKSSRRVAALRDEESDAQVFIRPARRELLQVNLAIFLSGHNITSFVGTRRPTKPQAQPATSV